MQTKIPGYRSYLLRCWEEFDEIADVPIWRFSLTDPHSGERQGFSNLTALVIALHLELFENEKIQEPLERSL